MLRKSLLVASALAGAMFVGVGAIAQSNANKSTFAGGLGLMAELDSSLDSKKAKVGDPIVARTTEALKVQGKTILPSGTKLIGHVVQSEARSKGDPSSVLAIQFEKAVLKNKEELPVALVIRAIASESHGRTDDTGPGSDPLADPRIGVTTSPMAGSRTSPPVAASPTAPGNSGDAGDAGGGLSPDGKLTPTSRGVYGIKGMRLGVDSSKTVPTSVVISTEKSVHLESGTRLLFFTQAVEAAASHP